MAERDPATGFRLFDVTPAMLRGIEVLAELDDEQLTEVSALCDGLHCMPDQFLLGRDGDPRCVYFILDGRVKITTYSSSEREVVFREMAAGQMVGELAAISGRRHSADVWTVDETKVARISDAGFRELMLAHPAATQRIARHLVELVYSLSERVFEHDSLRVDSRIHAELLRMARCTSANGVEAEISPAPTREELGKRIGTTRYAISNELSKLVRAGIIATERRRILVLDIPALERLVQMGNERGRYAQAASAETA